ncbi:hypothetical protein ACVMH6_002113 [Rhizobium leguminosarum]
MTGRVGALGTHCGQGLDGKDQICAWPPSTKSSIPLTKLASQGIVHLVFTTRRGLPPAVRALIDHLAAGFPRDVLGKQG